MRMLYLDVDTLRADHLGCYGYPRDTSPNIDRLAEEGVRFENCYASDAPCLPSRSALFSGRFGVHTGVVNHGGKNADPRLEEGKREFQSLYSRNSWVSLMARKGFHTVTVSPFAERHSAWWFYAGFKEIYNPGICGMERADEVFPFAEKWLKENAKKPDWFLHVNFWDPHTPYRTPLEFGNPFKDSPLEGWLTEDILKKHKKSFGPHSASEPHGFGYETWWREYPRVPERIETIKDYKRWIDGYDTGISYTDAFIGKIVEILKKEGVWKDTIVILSSDHGENQGELNVYGDHQTADYITSRVPLIIRWPGLGSGVVDRCLHYQTDMAATVLDLLGIEIPECWDGESFAASLRGEKEVSRDFLVVSQCAWSCQRGVIFDDFILIRTYHTGLKNFPEYMLFNLREDPHEVNNLAENRPELVKKGIFLLEKWLTYQMETSENKTDPLWEVIEEGGPFHTRDKEEEMYYRRLKETGREKFLELLKVSRGKPISKF